MRTWFRIVGWVCAVVGAVSLVLYLGFFDVWTVPADDPMLSASIQPTLAAGDVLVVSRSAGASRGYLLRCADPQAPGRFVVARAIGRHGDRLDLDREVVSIDGQRTPSPRSCDPPTLTLDDPRTAESVDLACSVEDYGDLSYRALRSADRPEPATRVTVEPGAWYLVSDNRHIHIDSRDYGPIDPKTCQHVVFRIMSGAGFGDADKRLTVLW